MLRISIRGLSTVVLRKTAVYEVLLNPMEHVATIMIMTQFLDPLSQPEASRWNPDHINFIPVFDPAADDPAAIIGFRQIAVWNITGKRVTIGKILNSSKWDNRSKTFAFDDHHVGSQTTDAPRDFGVVAITEGRPSSEEVSVRPIEYTLFDRFGEHEIKTTALAQAVTFTDAALQIVNAEGRYIQCKPAKDNNENLIDPVAVIANLAAEPVTAKALGHFGHYYKIIRDANNQEIDESARISLGERSAEVYDCVPPTGAP